MTNLSLGDAFAASHSKNCQCYRCTGDPNAFGFTLFNSQCQKCTGLPDDEKHSTDFCEKHCLVRRNAIKKFLSRSPQK